MAFKATRKPSTKKIAKATKAEEPVASQAPVSGATQDEAMPSISIEDLVGAPKGTETKGVSAPAVEPKGDVTPRPYSGQNRGGFDRGPLRSESSRSDFGRSRGRFDRGHRGGFGHDRGGDRFGRDYHRSSNTYNGGYRRDEGYRRDFSEANTSYTPDVDVPTETVRGVLDTMPDGHGFLRPKYTPSEKDIYISQSQIRRFLLRNGDMVEGQARPPKDNERYWGLLKVEKVNELLAEQMENRPRFEDLVPVYPNKHLRLETEPGIFLPVSLTYLLPLGLDKEVWW